MTRDEFESSRWEHGSQFHLMEPRASETVDWPWTDDALFWGTGRDALEHLLDERLTLGDDGRVWVPSYFCQKVVGAMEACGPPLAVYRDEPGRPFSLPDDVAPGDAVFVLNRFGLGAAVDAESWPEGVVRIEDHSHDPLSGWAKQSSADWCIASLRKSLPVPDGAVLWSPRGHATGAAPGCHDRHRAAAGQMLASMSLKRMYLRGLDVPKQRFRQIYKTAESALGSRRRSAMTEGARAMVDAFPAEQWREERAQNWQWLYDRLDGRIAASILVPRSDDGVPYAVVCRFDSAERRTRVRQALIDRRIYPAALWPMDAPVVDVPRATVEMAPRLFCLQCDMRYGREDLRRVAEAMLELDGIDG